MKLGIGTVQFGMHYGISNKSGQTPKEEVKKILSIAAEKNIKVIDTAASYGSSEKVLGEALPRNHEFSIITKTPHFLEEVINRNDAALLKEMFVKSLSNLSSESLYGLLIHDSNDLLKKNGQLLFESMSELKEKGLVKKIGVSVYNGFQIDEILKRYKPDLIQLPVNIFDQRLLLSGHIAKLKELGVEIHARSVFLQGLLLMKSQEVSPYFNSFKKHFEQYTDYISKEGITQIQATLGFVLGLEEIDVVLCGVNNHFQLLEICSSCALDKKEFLRFAIDDEKILNPSIWA